MLGTFRYVGKPDRKHTASDAAVRCVVHLFVMHVAEELQTWPEHSERQRVWVRAHQHAPAFLIIVTLLPLPVGPYFPALSGSRVTSYMP